MSQPRDQFTLPNSNAVVSQRVAASIVGSLFGGITGYMSGPIAKLTAFFLKDEGYPLWQLTELTLVVIVLFTCIIAFLGVYTTKRGWTNEEQIVLSVVSSLLIAFITIIEQSLPESKGNGDLLRFYKQLHSIGWLFVFWLIPIVILPTPDGSLSTKIRLGVRLIALSAAMAFICGIVGAGLTQILRDAIRNADYLEMIRYSSDCNICRDPLMFWMIRPVSFDPLWGIFFVVAFLPIWRRDLWQHVKMSLARVWWVVIAIVFAMLYSGIYGWKLYPSKDGWAENLMASNLISEWDFFFAFGAFPATGAIVVLFCCWLSRQKESENNMDWPVSNRFWWLLPVGFAVGFAATAKLFIAPIIDYDGASVCQINFLIISHAVNGVVLGLTLLAFIPLKRKLISK